MPVFCLFTLGHGLKKKERERDLDLQEQAPIVLKGVYVCIWWLCAEEGLTSSMFPLHVHRGRRAISLDDAEG